MTAYVKFQRGSKTAYEALKEAGQLDKDTLYFVYDDINSPVGIMYMGEKLIAGCGNEDLPIISIEDEGKVLGVVEGMPAWVNSSAPDIDTINGGNANIF